MCGNNVQAGQFLLPGKFEVVPVVAVFGHVVGATKNHALVKIKLVKQQLWRVCVLAF